MLITQRLRADPNAKVSFTLALTAEERTRSRHRFETEGQAVVLRLPRGTVLWDGDLLQAETDGSLVRITAKPELVLNVTAPSPQLLMRAAYHLGNRHVPVEIAATYLRLSFDSVLQTMLLQLGMEVQKAVLPFQPELGAYGNHAH